jgi:hypothetical protein
MNTISVKNRKLSLQDMSHDLTLAEMDRIAGGVSNCVRSAYETMHRLSSDVNLTSRSWDHSPSHGPVAHGVMIKANWGPNQCGI